MNDKRHKHKIREEDPALESEDSYARGAGSPGADGSETFDASTETLADENASDGQIATEVDSEPDTAGDPAAVESDRYLRLAAEYDNFRKRTAREKQEAESRGQADLVRQIIDPLDDIGRFAHVDPAVTDPVTLVQGVEMIEKKLAKILGAAGLEILDPVDQTFDPALHEAVATEPAASRDDDHQVARVYQLGYLFKGQLLRPARVVVKQWNS